MVSRAGWQIARKIKRPPNSTSTVSGYNDHNANPPRKKATFISHPKRGINAPKAIKAPPNMYSAPRGTYRISVTTAVTIRHRPAVTGKANGKNQLPPVA